MKIVELEYTVPTVQNYVVPVNSGGGGDRTDVNAKMDRPDKKASETKTKK
jgi:hypothetical protein